MYIIQYTVQYFNEQRIAHFSGENLKHTSLVSSARSHTRSINAFATFLDLIFLHKTQVNTD